MENIIGLVMSFSKFHILFAMQRKEASEVADNLIKKKKKNVPCPEFK